MDRNNVIVTGLSTKDELSNVKFHYAEHFTEKEYIFLDKTDYPMMQINELNVSLLINAHREVTISNERLMFLEGEKFFSITYSTSENKVLKTEFSYPYTLLIKLPPLKGDVESVKVYLIDIYPYYINEYTIYCTLFCTAAVNFQKIPHNNSRYKENYAAEYEESSTYKRFDPEEECM